MLLEANISHTLPNRHPSRLALCNVYHLITSLTLNTCINVKTLFSVAIPAAEWIRHQRVLFSSYLGSFPELRNQADSEAAEHS